MGRQQQTLERPGYLHPGVSGCHRTRRWQRCYQGNTGPPASLGCSRAEFLNVWSSPTCLSVTEHLSKVRTVGAEPQETPLPHTT